MVRTSMYPRAGTGEKLICGDTDWTSDRLRQAAVVGRTGKGHAGPFVGGGNVPALSGVVFAWVYTVTKNHLCWDE